MNPGKKIRYYFTTLQEGMQVATYWTAPIAGPTWTRASAVTARTARNTSDLTRRTGPTRAAMTIR